MAVLEDIQVTIEVNGQEVHEYYDEDGGLSNGSSISKYIEATSGATFAIKISIPKSYSFTSDCIGASIYLDGSRMEKVILLRTEVKQSRHMDFKEVIKGLTRYGNSGWEVRPFTFAEITPMDGASNPTACKADSIRVADLGVIAVYIFRKSVVKKDATKGWEDVKNMEGALEMPEKDLKGRSVTHGIRLGRIQSSEPSTVYKAEYVDGEDSPIATFKFKYCSRKALQGLLLVPRTPSPTRSLTPKSLEERPFDTLTSEEQLQLARILHARYQAERERNVKTEARVKPEPGFKAEQGVKRERDEEYEEIMGSARAKKVPRPLANGETVVLD